MHVKVFEFLGGFGYSPVSKPRVIDSNFSYFVDSEGGVVDRYIGVRYLARGRLYSPCIGFDSKRVWSYINIAATEFGNSEVKRIVSVINDKQRYAKGYWPIFFSSFANRSGFSVDVDLLDEKFLADFHGLVSSLRLVRSLDDLFGAYALNGGLYDWRGYCPSSFMLVVQVCVLAKLIGANETDVLERSCNYLQPLKLSSDLYANNLSKGVLDDFLRYLFLGGSG